MCSLMISVEKMNILLKAIIDRPRQFGLRDLLSETYHMIGLTLHRIEEARKLSLTISNLNWHHPGDEWHLCYFYYH